MLKPSQASRVLTAAVLLGSLAVAPAYAADATAPAAASSGHNHKHHDHENMAQKVEDRIKTLHAKLNITPEQEPLWNDVAQAMRDSEANISNLIHERHQNASTLTAVQDLQSYQQIAQAHADGLQKVTAAFGKLYDNMSDGQKENADKVFGGFEGHEHHHDGGKNGNAGANQ